MEKKKYYSATVGKSVLVHDWFQFHNICTQKDKIMCIDNNT